MRKPALTCLNFYFLSLLVRAAYPLGVLFGLLAATYVLGELKVRCGSRVPQAVWTLAVVALWSFLFLAKDSLLLGPANPFYAHPLQLVGISYLVFRCIHYLSDVECLEGRHPLTFLNYAIFFPTLLAGPIERYERFQPFFDGRDPQAPRGPAADLPSHRQRADQEIRAGRQPHGVGLAERPAGGRAGLAAAVAQRALAAAALVPGFQRLLRHRHRGGGA